MVYVQSYGAYRLRTKSSVKCSPCVAAASWAGVDNHLLGQIRGGLALDAAPDASKRSTAPVAAHAETAPQDPNGSQGLKAHACAPTQTIVGKPDFATGCSLTMIYRGISLWIGSWPSGTIGKTCLALLGSIPDIWCGKSIPSKMLRRLWSSNRRYSRKVEPCVNTESIRPV